MIQSGRKSKEAAATATVTDISRYALPAPDDFSEQEAEVWASVVATRPRDWWDAGNIPLLEQYCRAVVQSHAVAQQVRKTGQELAEDMSALKNYKELRKMQSALSHEITTLARSMRLTQQAQYTNSKAAIAARGANTKKPWDPQQNLFDAS